MRNRQPSAIAPLAASPFRQMPKKPSHLACHISRGSAKFACGIARPYAVAFLPSPFCSHSHLPIQLLLNRSAVRLSANVHLRVPRGSASRRVPAALRPPLSLRPPDPPSADRAYVLSVYLSLTIGGQKQKQKQTGRRKALLPYFLFASVISIAEPRAECVSEIVNIPLF